jgi:predicted transposase/invertase (TIGR01784 family)
LRLDDEAIDYKLRKEFRMFITDDKEIELLLTRQEGQLEGLQKGLLEGLQEGRQEERREMVMKMLVKGLTLDTISELSGLSEREIIALRDGPRTN